MALPFVIKGTIAQIEAYLFFLLLRSPAFLRFQYATQYSSRMQHFAYRSCILPYFAQVFLVGTAADVSQFAPGACFQ